MEVLEVRKLKQEAEREIDSSIGRIIARFAEASGVQPTDLRVHTSRSETFQGKGQLMVHGVTLEVKL